MTKKKGFWAALAAVSLAAVAFSGYSIYTRLTVHLSNDSVQIGHTEVPPLPEPEKSEETTSTAPQNADQQAAKPAPEAKEEPAKQKAAKIRFEYKNSKAKRVCIAGSFTSWKETPLAKKNGVWKADVYILPGTYLYHFVVDGKKVPDPSKPKSPVGESIVAVENVQ